MSIGDWLQDPLWTPKSVDVQIPCIRCCLPMHTVGLQHPQKPNCGLKTVQEFIEKNPCISRPTSSNPCCSKVNYKTYYYFKYFLSNEFQITASCIISIIYTYRNLEFQYLFSDTTFNLLILSYFISPLQII